MPPELLSEPEYSYESFATVEQVLDGDVIIVGEEHFSPGAQRSRELAEQVFNFEQPQSVAIEATRAGASRSSGMGVLKRKAQQHGLPLAAIDSSWRGHLRELGGQHDVSGLLTHANMFTHPIDSMGNLNPKAIENSRQIVYELYGEEVSLAMHDLREKDMAARLRHMLTTGWPTPIIAGVGAFHVPSLAENLREGIQTEELTSGRVNEHARDYL